MKVDEIMFSKPKQKSGRKERKKQDEGKAKMTKFDKFFTQTQATQAKSSILPEASSSSPASSTNEAASTLPPHPASPGGQKETFPPPQPQRSESADLAVPTSGSVAGITLPTDRGLYYRGAH